MLFYPCWLEILCTGYHQTVRSSTTTHSLLTGYIRQRQVTNCWVSSVMRSCMALRPNPCSLRCLSTNLLCSSPNVSSVNTTPVNTSQTRLITSHFSNPQQCLHQQGRIIPKHLRRILIEQHRLLFQISRFTPYPIYLLHQFQTFWACHSQLLL